jgi:mannosyltransferase
VEDGSTGLVFPPGDAKALAEKMRFLADDAENTFRMGLAAKSLVKEKFSLDIHCSRIESIYSEAMGRSFAANSSDA